MSILLRSFTRLATVTPWTLCRTITFSSESNCSISYKCGIFTQNGTSRGTLSSAVNNASSGSVSINSSLPALGQEILISTTLANLLSLIYSVAFFTSLIIACLAGRPPARSIVVLFATTATDITVGISFNRH